MGQSALECVIVDEIEIKVPLGDRQINVLFINYEAPVPDWEYGSHFHSSIELHYIPSGKGKILTQNQCFEIASGALFVVGANVVHAQKADHHEPMCEYCINFEIKPRKKNQSDAKLHQLVDTLNHMKFWFGSIGSELEQLFEQVFYELKNRETGCYSCVQNLISVILIRVLRQIGAKSGIESDLCKKTLDDARRFVIDEYLNQTKSDMTISDLAKEIGISNRHLERIVKQYYGVSFTEKKIEVKLAKSMELLKETPLSVKDISEVCGFSSPSYYSRLFSKRFSVSPTEYRSHHSQNCP